MTARVVLLVVLAAAALVRLQTLDVPLDRDEGEFAYMGQLILAGEVPYLAAHNMKLPGAYYAYAAVLGVLGDGTAAIRLGLLVANLAAILLVYRLGVTILDRTAGAGAAAAYAVLSLDPAVLGFAAKAEHFVVVPLVAGVTILARDDRPRWPVRLFASGLLLGGAIVMKQHAVAFALFGVLWIVARHGVRQWRRAAAGGAIFAAGVAAPLAATAAGMYLAGAFEPFVFWTITYAREYATLIPLATGLGELGRQAARIARSSAPLWVLAGVGVTALAWDKQTRPRALFLAGFAASSLLAIVPGLRFSEHYFILLLPAACLLVGAGASALARSAEAWAPPAAPVVRWGVPLVGAGAALAPHVALYREPPAVVARRVFGLNPFPEAIEVARYLREHSAPDDRVAVIGSEPEIYFYAARRAAVSYMYVYPLMEPQPFARRMQADMIAQLERTRPAFMVLVNVPTSWSLQPGSPRDLLEWVERTVNTEYRLVGLVDIMPDGRTAYRWDDAASGAQPASAHHLAIFRRG